MRIVLSILLASAAALALIALLVRPEASLATLSRARPPVAAPAAVLALRQAEAIPPPPAFALPLTERALPAGRRAEPLEPELREAMDRIEPVIDPTRLDGPFSPPEFRIWPGTASLVDAFGEHWRLGSDDPNVQRKVRSYALAWHRAGRAGCDDFVKNRPHPLGAPVLSALAVADCERILRRDGERRDAAAPVPIVAAPLSLAVFAAPQPGARMSSEDFWAAQARRVAAVRDRLQRKWQAGRDDNGIGLRD